MLLRLFLLFTLVPSFELWLLFQVKEQLGLFETIWLVIITGMIGASMAKTQGILVLQEIQERSKQGLPPTQTLLEGVLVLVGGVLLVTPGILTDAFGFSLILPWTRRLWAPLVKGWFGNRMSVQGNLHFGGFGPGAPMGSPDQNKDTIQDTVSVEQPSSAQPRKKGFSHPKF